LVFVRTDRKSSADPNEEMDCIRNWQIRVWPIGGSEFPLTTRALASDGGSVFVRISQQTLHAISDID
jgi:hypothetical protein